MFSIKNISWRKRVILSGIALLLLVYIFCLPKRLFDVPYATVVTDRNGELLGARIADDEQWRFPPCETLPEKYKTCLVAFEDRYFRYHWGVNPLSVGRALIQNVKQRRVVSGGSTITMQVVRLSRDKNRTFGEKLLEMILATRLEFRYSKEKILTLYASHAPFGGNVVGLDAAAWRYFGHSANQLSWAESATLAVLPNAPSLLHLSKNREALLEKRNRLLTKLLENQQIHAGTYELAISESLPDEPLALPQIAPHWVTSFYTQHKGEHSVSTLDKSLQLRVEDVLDRWNQEFLQQDIRNLAAIVIDVKTNEIIAYCGNVRTNPDKFGNQVDIIQSERSTGSILKPFLYCACLQEGEILPRTLLPDIPLNINGFTPQNFNRQFEGAVPAAETVSRSLNVPLVYLLRKYSVPKFYDFLKQNRIASLPQPAGHYGLSLILGGAEAKLGDIANAYTQMARTLQGIENPSTFEAGAVWQVFDALTEVNRPEQIDWRSIASMQKIAWKTGTSYGFRDAWAVGATPKYVVGVWVGNASGEGKPNLTGARTAGPVLFDIFNLLPSSEWFKQPSGELIEAEICRQSGHLKSRFCEEIDTVLICPNGLRSPSCPYHNQNGFVLPPAWAAYYKQHHPEYQTQPSGENSGQPMQFIYPQGNVNVRLPKQLDGKEGEITFELAHNRQSAVVFWHIDNEYVGSTTEINKLSRKLSLGSHTVTVVDDEGNTLSCRILVE